MTDKQRVTLNLSRDNVSWLDDVSHNRSAKVDEMLTQFRKGGCQIEQALKRMRKDQLMEKKRSLESRVESVESELDSLNDEITSQEERKGSVIREAYDTLGDVPTDPEGAHIQHWASKANMSPEEFAEQYEEMLQ